MANITRKMAKLAKIENKIKTKILGVPGAKTFILKRNGRTKPFDILATFDWIGVFFDNYRHSLTIDFAVYSDETFSDSGSAMTMFQISRIATHIAQTKPNGESIVYAINNGDEWEPYYLDNKWKFYIRQVGDPFVEADNL